MVSPVPFARSVRQEKFRNAALAALAALILPCSSANAATTFSRGFVPTGPILDPAHPAVALNSTAVEAKRIADLIRGGEFDKAIAAAAELAKSAPDDPAGFNLQGTAYLGKSDWTNARRSFQRALAIRSDDAIALVNLAQIDIQQKDPAAARKRFQAVLARDGANVEAMLGMAQLEFQRDNDKAALDWLVKARSARPQSTDPRLSIAAFHLRRANYAEATRELEDASRAIPGNADILNLLGQAQMSAGQAQFALGTYRQLVAARPESPLSHYRLATAQVATNDVAGAMQSLDRALRQKPDFVDALVLLATLEAQAKRYDRALALAERVKTAQPRTATGFVLEGDIHGIQERHADAAKAYERAFAAAPSGLVVVKLHAAQVKAGNTKAADATLAKWLREHPDDVGSQHYAAADSLRRGDVKGATQRYEGIVARYPKDVLALNNLAGLYHQARDPRALPTAESAYKLASQSAGVQDTLGWILVGQGSTSRGLKLLESAAGLEPSSPEIRYHLAVARARSGDKRGARRDLEALLAGNKPFADREAARTLLNEL